MVVTCFLRRRGDGGCGGEGRLAATDREGDGDATDGGVKELRFEPVDESNICMYI